MNDCKFIGNIANELELKKTEAGVSYVKFGLAVSGHKRQDGSYNTTFVECEMWDSGAENFVERFSKGDKVFVEGEYRPYVEVLDEATRSKRTWPKFRVTSFKNYWVTKKAREARQEQ